MISKEIDLFENILVRIGGESFSEIQVLDKEYSSLFNDINYLTELNKKKKNFVAEFCNALHSYISCFEDPIGRKKLLNFKRNIFNDRSIKGNIINDIKGILNDNLSAQYEIIDNIRRDIILCENNIENKYYELIIYENKIISKFCENENFLKGLLLSSDYLFSFAKDTSKIIANTFEPEHIGLWKYISRMVTKTSPFSTFTNVSISSLKQQKKNIDIECPDKVEIGYSINYNNNILKIIINILKNNYLFYRNLLIRKNDTLQIEHSHFLFLTSSNNIEAFQRIERNSTLDLILDFTNNDHITFIKLVDRISESIDSSIADINTYIYEIIKTGLLVFDIEISGMENQWEISLKKILLNSNYTSKNTSLIIETIDKLIAYRQEYSKSNITQREVLLIKMQNNIINLMLLLHEDAQLPDFEKDYIKGIFKNDSSKKISHKYQHVKPERIDETIFLLFDQTFTNISDKNIIYEDTSINIGISLEKKRTTQFIKKLADFINSFSFLCSNENNYTNYLNFYKYKFPNLQTVKFLEFYKAFSEYEIQNRYNDNIDKFVSQALININERFSEIIKNGSSFDKHENIYSINSSSIIDQIPLKYRNKKINLSYSALIQFYADKEEKFKGVLNGIFFGYGKFMGRFLYLFNNNITKKLQEWNTAKMGDGIFCENKDASFFNANLHPPLFPFEIIMPGSQNKMSGDNQIKISDIHIVFDIKKDSLELFYKNEKKLVIANLDLQDHKTRSKAFQMLDDFGSNFNFNLLLFNEIINNFVENIFSTKNGIGKNILFLPQIIYDDSIVFQRKKWLIPASIIKKMIKGENDLYFFKEIQKWRNDLSLPEEVFVRIISNLNSSNDKKKSRKIGKPQYINFLSPISVKVLSKMFQNELSVIMIEEMLPTSNQLIEINGRKFVSEHLIQWQ